MQLDKTRIAIRERTTVELLDLTWLVLRAHADKLIGLMLLGALPFALWNAWVLGGLCTPATHALSAALGEQRNPRYYWDMILLVFIEAPLAGTLVTLYLGQAVFTDPPSLREIWRDLRPTFGHQLYCQGLLRMVFPAMILAATISPAELSATFVELLGLGAIGAYVGLVRGVRPYVSEVVLLERNPLRARRGEAITIGRRMTMLHAAGTGELISAWLASALVSWLLVLAIVGTMYFLARVLWAAPYFSTWWMLHLFFPATLWCVAGYTTVFRFLGYLDLRIRHEGWEVDLLLRAEAQRWETPSLVDIA